MQETDMTCRWTTLRDRCHGSSYNSCQQVDYCPCGVIGHVRVKLRVMTDKVMSWIYIVRFIERMFCSCE